MCADIRQPMGVWQRPQRLGKRRPVHARAIPRQGWSTSACWSSETQKVRAHWLDVYLSCSPPSPSLPIMSLTHSDQTGQVAQSTCSRLQSSGCRSSQRFRITSSRGRRTEDRHYTKTWMCQCRLPSTRLLLCFSKPAGIPIETHDHVLVSRAFPALVRSRTPWGIAWVCWSVYCILYCRSAGAVDSVSFAASKWARCAVLVLTPTLYRPVLKCRVVECVQRMWLCVDVQLCSVWEKHVCNYFVTPSPLLLHDLVKRLELLRIGVWK